MFVYIALLLSPLPLIVSSVLKLEVLELQYNRLTTLPQVLPGTSLVVRGLCVCVGGRGALCMVSIIIATSNPARGMVRGLCVWGEGNFEALRPYG